VSKKSWAVGRVAGVEVRVDSSWLFIAALVVWSFWGRFSSGPDRHGVAAAFGMGVVAAVVFFASVLAHELAHALEARHRGVEVGGITLYLFGGATEMVSDAARSGDAFALSAIGPYTSLVLGAGLGLVASGAGRGGWGPVAEVAGSMGWINVILGVFNLLPGAPLDGGRILQSIVWRLTGDRHRGSIVAARAGRLLGALVMTAGFFEAFSVVGGLIGGLWLLFIGWFLAQAAVSEQLRSEVEAVLDDRSAGSLLAEQPETVEPATSLGWIVQAEFRRHHIDVVPVAVDGAVVGVVRVEDAGRVPAERRFETTASDVMVPVDDLPHVATGDPAVAILRSMRKPGVVAVTDGPRVVGVVSAGQLSAMLERIHLLHSGWRGRGRGRR